MSLKGAEWSELTDLQKRRLEARAIANEDEQFRHMPLSWIARDRRGYALYKTRWSEVLGLQGSRGGWSIDALPVADFGGMTAAATQRTGFTIYPLINPAMSVLKSPDPEPFQEPGGTLAAIVGDRQIGTSLNPIVILIGAYVYHSTAAGAVFAPAATTLNIRVQSAFNTVGGAFTTLATLVINTAVNFIDQLPIIGTTGRFVSVDGGANAAAAALFNGDSLFAELVAGAAIQTNLLVAMVELA